MALARAVQNSHDDAIRVNTKTLIALAHAAESLPLKSFGIRAQQIGNYLSPFKGRGMEFDEARPYQPGDDIRTIDWKVTARTNTTHTKVFREERERPVLICTDLSSSMFFATRGAFKSVIAAKIAALLSWSAAAHGDRLGGLIFSEYDHKEIRPRRGKSAVLHYLKELCDFHAWQDHGNNDDMQSTQHSLARLRRVARPGSLVFILSDFKHLDDDSIMHLTQIARHSDVILVHISDPFEAHLPENGVFRLKDNKRETQLSTYKKSVLAEYENRFAEHVAKLKNLTRRYGMFYLPCLTNDNILKKLQTGLGLKAR